jgi:predicted XRE-type DNA-binding protein
LVVQLKRLIAERGLTQTAAAKLIELKQPDLSKLFRGQLRLVSVEKLMRMLTAFDQDVEITVRPIATAVRPAASPSFRQPDTSDPCRAFELRGPALSP